MGQHAWAIGSASAAAWRPTQRYADRLERWAARHGRRQRRRARHMTQTYMRAIYQLTTVNMDHVLSGLLLIALHTYQRCRFPVAELKRRVYVAAQTLRVAADHSSPSAPHHSRGTTRPFDRSAASRHRQLCPTGYRQQPPDLCRWRLGPGDRTAHQSLAVWHRAPAKFHAGLL